MQVPDAIILERQSWNPRGLWRLLFWNERSQLPWLKWVWHREHTKRCIYSSEKSSILKTSLKRIENDLTSQSVSARSKVFVYFDLEIIKLVRVTYWTFENIIYIVICKLSFQGYNFTPKWLVLWLSHIGITSLVTKFYDAKRAEM